MPVVYHESLEILVITRILVNMNMFSKKGRKRIKGFMVVIGILVSISMVLLYSGIFAA
jgi:uncharacterized membrane protein YecN with MAPEG domain